MRFPAFFCNCRPFALRSIAIALIAWGQFLIACDEAGPSGPAGNPDAQLVLLEPKGGEEYRVGDSLFVRWKAQGKGLEDINSVTVSLSPDSGATWFSLKNGSIATADVQWGDFRWKIPSQILVKGVPVSLAGSARILVRVQDYVDMSDANKTAIVLKPISVKG